jgi:uncharacterized protein YkwD
MRRTPLAFAAALACSEPSDPPPEVPDIGYCEEVASWDPAHAEFEREVLELVNQRRSEGGSCEGAGDFSTPADPLTMNAALRCAARKHTLAMIAGNYFDHLSPEGQTFQERAMLAEYEGEPLAESIAAGLHEPEQVVTTLMNNDGNCANLMNPDATELGVGYMPASEAMYSEYWTLVFGR